MYIRNLEKQSGCTVKAFMLHPPHTKQCQTFKQLHFDAKVIFPFHCRIHISAISDRGLYLQPCIRQSWSFACETALCCRACASHKSARFRGVNTANVPRCAPNHEKKTGNQILFVPTSTTSTAMLSSQIEIHIYLGFLHVYGCIQGFYLVNKIIYHLLRSLTDTALCLLEK